MRIFISFLLISISSIAICQDTAKYSLPDDLGVINLNGKIKKVIKFYLDTSLEDSNRKKLASISTYNQKMLLIEEANFKEEKEMTEKTTYSYNEKNKLVKKLKSGMSNWSVDYYYNERNLLVKEIKDYFDDNIKLKTEYYYDKKNNLIEMLEIDNNDSIDFTRIYKYDNNNNQIEYLAIDKIGSEFKINYEYDTSGNKIMSISGMIRKFSYNEDKKLIKVKKSRISGEPDYTELYSYNTNGLLTEKITLDEKLKEIYKTTYNYNKNGNLFQLIQYEGQRIETIYEFQYEYYD